MNKNILPDSREELVSMFLGLGVVIIVVIVIFNFVMKAKGNISLPGVSTDEQIVLTNPSENKIVDSGLYEVVKGDSLWNIAVKKYGNGYLWTEIAKENKMKNPSSIEIGQKLVIPVVSDTIAKAVPKIVIKPVIISTYKVVRGDSLWKIAVSQLGNGYKWTQIWNLNKGKIVDPNRLEIGMMIKLR